MKTEFDRRNMRDMKEAILDRINTINRIGKASEN
jgi:hypothetical protein